MIRRLIILLLIVGCGTEPEDCADGDSDGICDWNDADSYATVQIGTQFWMAENLRATHYKNGDELHNISYNQYWRDGTTGYGDYDNNPTNAETYGKLYNWITVDDSRGICPQGWHVPSDDEWTILTDYLGGTSLSGGKMKEEGLEHWNYYSDEITEEATNESGFTGLPAGMRSISTGTYNGMGLNNTFWSSSEASYHTLAWTRSLSYRYSQVSRIEYNKKSGFSIRCLKD